MGFWEDLWQGTRKVFCKSCPRCKTNDADQPSGQKIIRKLISQHSHRHMHFHRGHDGKMHPQTRVVWNKYVEFQCQACGHIWKEHEHNKPLPG